jgi:RNA polymerase sigma-70 factor (ECF subfamily)
MERASRRHENDGRVAASSDGEEARLVEGARALGEEAWAEIYRRHAQQVYGYIYFRLGDQHTAEDLTADVFVKAIAGIKSYAYRGTPLLAWLYRIAHNVTVDYRKAAARRMQHISDAPADDIEEREDALAMLDDRSDMLSAIRALTEDQQQVILLRFYQGLSNAEVAAVMGKPEGAVKALQSRGLRSLRRMIGAGVQGATA